MRVCHVCETKCEDGQVCNTCVAAFDGRKNADEMTSDKRVAEMRLISGPLEIPFELVHKRIEELVGRPVWTHEMGLNWEGLVAEAAGREHPSFEAIVDLIPEEKRIVVGG